MIFLRYKFMFLLTVAAMCGVLSGGPVEKRSESLSNDLKTLEKLKIKHGGDFVKWQRELLPVYSEYNAFADKTISGWWLGDSFFKPIPFYVQPTGNAGVSHRIAEYSAYLKSRGIDLILVRMPFKADLAFCMFNQEKSAYANPLWLVFFENLIKQDIEVIDTLPAMVKGASAYPCMYDFVNSRNPNPGEGAAMTAARLTAARLNRYNFSRPRGVFSTSRQENAALKTPNWPNGNVKFPQNSGQMITVVSQSNGGALKLEENSGSPVLVLSSEFARFPSHSQGAGFAHYLSLLVGFPVDEFYRGPLGGGMIRYFFDNPALLNGRKVVIWLVHPTSWNGELPKLLCGLPDDSKVIKTYKFGQSDKSIALSPADANAWNEQASFLQVMPVNGQNSGRGGRIELTVPEGISGPVIIRLNLLEHMFCRIEALSGGERDFTEISDIAGLCNRVLLQLDDCSNGKIELNFDWLSRRTPLKIESIDLLTFPKKQIK